MLDVVVGLGANLGDPTATFVAALDELSRESRLIGVSRLWRTSPVGPDQADYTNAAVLIGWPGDLRSLLHSCLGIETAAGRDRDTEERWGPRVLDLDLLIARDLVWRSRELSLPHPRFHLRAFALVPAAELAPDWVHPLVGSTISELAQEVLAAEAGAVISSTPFPSELPSVVD